MDSQARIEAIAAASPEGVQALFEGAEPGFSADYFATVARAMGSDPALARRLAGYWRHLPDRPYRFRLKGALERMNGRWEASARSFLSAGRSGKDPVERLSFQVGAVDSLARAGKVPEAVRLGKRLSQGLLRVGEPLLAARVQLNVGNAYLWIDDYRSAGKWFRACYPALEEGGLATEAASAKIGLSSAELYFGSPWEAERLALEAQDAFARLGLDHHEDMCSLNLAQALLLRGRADEALTILQELTPSLLEADPYQEARTQEFAGDALLKLNRFVEAADAFELALGRSMLGPLDRAATLLSLGETYARLGDARAAETLLRAEKRLRALGVQPMAILAKIARGELARETGRLTAAKRLLAEAQSEAEALGSDFLTSRALLARCLVDPSTDLRRAERLAARTGMEDIVWRVHYARALSSDQPLRHFRRMADAIASARLLTTSAVSRAAFLEDKRAALSSYLGTLFSRPGRRSFDEAMDVISRTRSVALIDEITSSRALNLGDDELRRLDRLREDLAASGSERPGGGSRGAPAAPSSVARVRREWNALARRLVSASRHGTLADGARDAAVYAVAGDRLYLLKEGTVRLLRPTVRELAAMLRWVGFELLAPQAEPTASGAELECLLTDLRKDLLIDPSPKGRHRICPDDLLWRVPWQALYGPAAEVQLLPAPSFTASAGEVRLPKAPRVCLWIDESTDLRHVGEEAEAIVRLFPDARVCRSSSEVRASLGESYDLVHVATHAKLDNANPMFSYLQFGDGRVYAADIARSSLRTRLAVLSACETGSVSLALSNEPDGLARCFLARSAEAVVASSWPLDDEVASKTMQMLYQEMVSGAPLSGSLAQARLQILHWRAHPYFWAPMVMFSGYGGSGC